jgi:hypothetical protein
VLRKQIAGSVPQAVVDQLEVVEVDRQQHHRPVIPGPRKRSLQPLGQPRSVGQARERVVVGEVSQTCLGLGLDLVSARRSMVAKVVAVYGSRGRRRAGWDLV